MQGLIDDVGQYRNTGVGVMKGKKVIHMAPSAECVNVMLNNSHLDVHKLDSQQVNN
jgi:hypothetical protein